MSRPLLLHVSALSADEYSLYQSAYDELVIDPGADGPDIGVREVRGWLRGRYPIDGGLIDKILRFFHPNLGAGDLLSPGQFYAALRLVTHVQAGAQVSPDLVFVQPWLANGARSTSPSIATNQRPVLPAPGRQRLFASDSETAPTAATSDPPRSAPPTTLSSNPFYRTAPRPSTAESSDESPVNKSTPVHGAGSPSIIKPATVSSNPFIIRASKSASAPPSQAAPPSVLAKNTSQISAVTPPLPPRKPLLPPPRHASLSTSNPSGPPKLPNKPPSLAGSHTTSPLIKQSLMAAKATQRSAELGLEKLRTWEIIQSSSPGRAPSPPQRSSSPSRYLITPSRSSPPHSVSSSALSRLTTDPIPESPTSPEVTPTRMGRSKSLHHPAGPPAPPPRKRRPESAQISPSPSLAALINSTTNISNKTEGLTSSPDPFTTPLPYVTRSTSLQPVARSEHPSAVRGVQTQDPINTLQKTLSQFQLKAKPGLENARAKMEGKLMPGGYGRWKTERLMMNTSSEDDPEEDVDADADASDLGRSTDESMRGSWSSPNGDGRRISNGLREQGSDEEVDSMSVTTSLSEGWRPLGG